ncbi:hypothetical protein LC613_16880 [Nostoc sphaeroides CHAB 2801]|uniref:restriction endonuclease n=1 Tax=Nostoc sphaeroides TaxID=446679 RepID=UPI000E4CEFC7|nr:restriction endonuclease [Nostoc sphaeroides]MCC5629633.1 hypothetical protein [Nostoc sphaeroides CHAB 2801]
MYNILERWSITVDELSQAILENGSLRGMVFGYVAEIKLRNILQNAGTIASLVKDDDHDRKKKGDLRITYKGHEFKIEAKSLQTARNKVLNDGTFEGVSQVDASDRRTVTLPDGSKLETTNLVVGEFDILAVNCFTFEDKWHFVFAKNKDLPRTNWRKYTEAQRQYLLATTVKVTWPPKGIFTDNIFSLLDKIIEEQSNEPKEFVIVEEKGKLPFIAEE